MRSPRVWRCALADEPLAQDDRLSDDAAVTMRARPRRLAVALHVVVSLGWLGAVVAYLTGAVIGLLANDPKLVRGAYLALEATARTVIVPLAIAALLTGLSTSIRPTWGLWRHRWVMAKLAVTTGAIVILLDHLPRVSEMARQAAGSTLAAADVCVERVALVVYAFGGLAVLVTVFSLSVFKPGGETAYGLGDLSLRRRYLAYGFVMLAVLLCVHRLAVSLA